MPYDIGIEAGGLEGGALPDIAAVHALCERVLAEEAVEDGAGLTIVLAGDELLRALNLEHRDVDAPTDVLSFPADEPGEDGEGFPGFPEVPGDVDTPGRYIGDIAISVETAAGQAAEAGLTLDEEVAHLVLHGLLHCLGYDHETPEDDERMRAREEAVLGPGIHASGAHADD